jgi:hypothetical protein
MPLNEQAKEWWKVGGLTSGCVFSLVLPLFRSFVVQQLWNWYITGTLHALDISFLEALGITLVAYALTTRQRRSVEEQMRWDQLNEYVAASVPEGKKENIDKERESLAMTWINANGGWISEALSLSRLLPRNRVCCSYISFVAPFRAKPHEPSASPALSAYKAPHSKTAPEDSAQLP